MQTQPASDLSNHSSARFTQAWRGVLTLTAVGVLVLAPIIINGIPRGNDLSHHYRVAVSFFESIRGGVLYPGWNANANDGFGDPSFRFYPPLIYYLLSGCRALTGNWYHASLLFFTLVSVTGGLGVYFWARTLLPVRKAVLAGILFLVAPYHLNEIYQASLLAEYAGSSILPFTFAFTELVCTRGRRSDIIGLAVSFALLILTHVPLMVIGSMALMIYALLRVNGADLFRTIFRLIVSVLLALGASAFYWVTVIAELQWKNVETSQWFDYRYNFLFWKTVDGSTSWWANVLAIATLMMFLPGLCLRRSWRGRFSANGLKTAAVVTVFSFAMALPLSQPLWMVMPPLQHVEFPWRWLAIVSLAGPLLVASTTDYWRNLARTRSRPVALLALACLVLPLALTISQTMRGATYLSRSRFETLTSTIAESDSLQFWWPVWAANKHKRMSDQIEVDRRSLAIESWEPEERRFQIGPGVATEARVRTFYYPCWFASSQNNALPLRPDNDGAILIQLPDTATFVTLKFREPLRRDLSMAMSIMVSGLLMILPIVLLWWRKNTRNSTPTEDS